MLSRRAAAIAAASILTPLAALGLALARSAALARPAAKSGTPPMRRAAKGPRGGDRGDDAAGRVVAVATLEKASYRRGEPIPVGFELRNRTAGPVTVWHSGFWPNHLVVVRDRDGVEPPLTPAGRERRAAFRPDGEREKNFPVVLRPGGSAREDGAADLADLYRLGPGAYTLVVSYDDRQGPTPTVAVATAIDFEVAAD
jgi:hypothetical protein